MAKAMKVMKAMKDTKATRNKATKVVKQRAMKRRAMKAAAQTKTKKPMKCPAMKTAAPMKKMKGRTMKAAVPAKTIKPMKSMKRHGMNQKTTTWDKLKKRDNYPKNVGFLDLQVQAFLKDLNLHHKYALPPVSERNATDYCGQNCLISVYKRLETRKWEEICKKKKAAITKATKTKSLKTLIFKVFELIAKRALKAFDNDEQNEEDDCDLAKEVSKQIKKNQKQKDCDLETFYFSLGDKDDFERFTKRKLKDVDYAAMDLVVQILNAYLRVKPKVKMQEFDKRYFSPSQVFVKSPQRPQQWRIVRGDNHYVAVLPK